MQHTQSSTSNTTSATGATNPIALSPLTPLVPSPTIPSCPTPSQSAVDAFYAQFDALAESERAAERRAKTQKRIAECGSYAWRFDPHTGKRVSYRKRCDMWRDGQCKFCVAYHAQQLKEQITEAIAIQADIALDNPLASITTTSDDADTITRKLRDMGCTYRRLPTATGDVIMAPAKQMQEVISNTTVADTTSPITTLNSESDLAAFDFQSLAVTPRGRNKSGKLGINAPASDNDGTVAIKVQELIVTRDTPLEVQNAAAALAENETADLQPTTPQEVEEALKQRTAAFKRIIEALGGKVAFTNSVVLRCRISCIAWINKEKLAEDRIYRLELSAGRRMLQEVVSAYRRQMERAA